MNWSGLLVLAAATPAALSAAAAPQLGVRLEVEPELFSSDSCLAPDFEGAGCARHANPHDDSRPTASAALLAPDLVDPAPLLFFDVAVLREGAEVTESS